MSNGTSNDLSGAIGSLSESVGKLVQVQVDLLRVGIVSTASLVGMLGKTSLDIASGVLNMTFQIVQGALSAITPKR
jgi:hypothetical protein